MVRIVFIYLFAIIKNTDWFIPTQLIPISKTRNTFVSQRQRKNLLGLSPLYALFLLNRLSKRAINTINGSLGVQLVWYVLLRHSAYHIGQSLLHFWRLLVECQISIHKQRHVGIWNVYFIEGRRVYGCPDICTSSNPLIY